MISAYAHFSGLIIWQSYSFSLEKKPFICIEKKKRKHNWWTSNTGTFECLFFNFPTIFLNFSFRSFSINPLFQLLLSLFDNYHTISLGNIVLLFKCFVNNLCKSSYVSRYLIFTVRESLLKFRSLFAEVIVFFWRSILWKDTTQWKGVSEIEGLVYKEEEIWGLHSSLADTVLRMLRKAALQAKL